MLEPVVQGAKNEDIVIGQVLDNVQKTIQLKRLANTCLPPHLLLFLQLYQVIYVEYQCS